MSKAQILRGQIKSLKIEIKQIHKVVAPPRLELGHPYERRILNPLRLPFRQEATMEAIILGKPKLCVNTTRGGICNYLNFMSSKASRMVNLRKSGPRCFLSSAFDIKQENFK